MRYIKILISIVYSILKFCIIKLFHFRTFTFTPISMISPLVGIEIGRNSKLSLGKKIHIRRGSSVNVRNCAEVRLGSGTFLNSNCVITSHEKILIGNNVHFGPNVLVYDHDHDFRVKGGLKDKKFITSPIIIGDDVWIGANTVILRGTRIGNGCVIGAGSVIKGEYTDNTLIVQKRETVCKEIILK